MTKQELIYFITKQREAPDPGSHAQYYVNYWQTVYQKGGAMAWNNATFFGGSG